MEGFLRTKIAQIRPVIVLSNLNRLMHSGQTGGSKENIHAHILVGEDMEVVVADIGCRDVEFNLMTAPEKVEIYRVTFFKSVSVINSPHTENRRNF